MSHTSRTPLQVMYGLLEDDWEVWHPEGGSRLSLAQRLAEALADEGWLRSPRERQGLDQLLTVQQVRDGTGWPRDARFIAVRSGG